MQGRVHSSKEFAPHHGKVQVHMQKLAFKNALTMAHYLRRAGTPQKDHLYLNHMCHPAPALNATLTLKQRNNK